MATLTLLKLLLEQWSYSSTLSNKKKAKSLKDLQELSFLNSNLLKRITNDVEDSQLNGKLIKS